MAKVTLQQFNGELPRTQAHYLPEGYAVSARNANLTSGSLRPMRGGSIAHTFGATGNVSAVQHGSVWFGFNVDVDAAPGPIASDRLYLTKETGAPEFYAGGGWLPLALQNPTVAPAVSLTGTLDPATSSDVVYAYTWVTPLGEESGPSPISAIVKFSAGTTITVAGLPTVAAVNGRPVSQKRIYRATTSASGATELFLIAEIAAAAGSFADVHGANPDMEAIPTKAFDPPPDNMRGLTAMPNGMMAAFAGKELLFSQPYQPHAWPTSYSLAVNEFIVGLCAFGSSLAVMTNGNPYLVQGLSPDAMAMAKVEAPFPCVAKRSIVDMGYAAVYASPLGLVQVGEGGASLVSNAIWSKLEWEKLQPETIQAARFGLAYIFSYVPKDGSIRKVAIVNLNGDQPSLVHCDIIAKGFYSDPASSRCYYLDEIGQNVYEFDVGDKLDYTWRSKPYRFSEPVPFGVVAVEFTETDPQGSQTGSMTRVADAGYSVVLSGADIVSQGSTSITIDLPPEDVIVDAEYSMLIAVQGAEPAADVRVNVYGDGLLRHSASPSIGKMMRLPSGKYREWQFEITGKSEILRVSIAHSIGEIGL